MLLTVLNKSLNHLCQTEGSEKREWGERRKRFPLQAKCHNKCIVFQSENLESKSCLPRDARGLLFSAICNFKYISMGVCAHASAENMYVRQTLGEKETRDMEARDHWGEGDWEKTQLYSFILMKCKSNSLMKAAVIAQTVLLCDNHT